MTGPRLPDVDGAPSPRASSNEGLAKTRAAPPWLVEASRLLDDAIRIPGTRITIGLDAIIGFVAPGVGDAATSLASFAFVWVAWKRGLPSVALMRMVVNIGIDALVGSIPFIGDIFDVAFRANRKNLELLERYAARESGSAHRSDYAVVVVAFVAVLAVALLPVVVIALIAALVGRAH